MDNETSPEDVWLGLLIHNCKSTSAISSRETGGSLCGKCLLFTWCLWLTHTIYHFLGMLDGAETVLLEREGNGCNRCTNAIKKSNAVIRFIESCTNSMD